MKLSKKIIFCTSLASEMLTYYSTLRFQPLHEAPKLLFLYNFYDRSLSKIHFWTDSSFYSGVLIDLLNVE